MIEFECLGCGSTFEVSESLAGKVIKCRECHQPGKVRGQSASGSGSKLKVNDPAGGPLPTPNKWEYHCPCCATRVLWDWKAYWTPTSTVALILAATINVYMLYWAWSSYRSALSGAVPTAGAAGGDSGGGLFGIFLMLGITAAVDVLAFRLLWEWRQECPRCGVRVG